LKPYFDAEGFEVYNCNPESKLELFPYVSYEDAVYRATMDLGNVDDERTFGMYCKPQEKQKNKVEPPDEEKINLKGKKEQLEKLKANKPSSQSEVTVSASNDISVNQTTVNEIPKDVVDTNPEDKAGMVVEIKNEEEKLEQSEQSEPINMVYADGELKGADKLPADVINDLEKDYQEQNQQVKDVQAVQQEKPSNPGIPDLPELRK
jgi:hypothetical protein